MAEGPSPFHVVASVKKDAAEKNLLSVDEMTRFREIDATVTCTELESLDGMVFDNVLSCQECKYLIERTEDMGYTFWDSRPDKVTEFRNADTIEVLDISLAAVLWSRIEGLLASKSVEISSDQSNIRWQRDLEGIWDPIGTNNSVLFARYRKGGHFAPHTDGYSIVDCDERSMYSIVLFLNNCSSGGGTRFYEEEQRDKLVKDEYGRYTGREELVKETVDPIAGRMVVFFHNVLHEGVPVGEGAEKYIIRSDVIYRRRNPVCKTEKDKKAFALYQEAQELGTDGRIDESMAMFRRAFKMSPTLADVYGM